MKFFKYIWAIFCIILGATLCYLGFVSVFKIESLVSGLVLLAIGLWLANAGFKVFRKKSLPSTENIKK